MQGLKSLFISSDAQHWMKILLLIQEVTVSVNHLTQHMLMLQRSVSLWITITLSGSVEIISKFGSRPEIPHNVDFYCHQKQLSNHCQPINRNQLNCGIDSDGCPLLLEPTTSINVSGALYHHEHNNWDNMRNHRSWTYLKCRECNESWKLDVFLCTTLRKMRILNIHLRRLKVERREELFGKPINSTYSTNRNRKVLQPNTTRFDISGRVYEHEHNCWGTLRDWYKNGEFTPLKCWFCGERWNINKCLTVQLRERGILRVCKARKCLRIGLAAYEEVHVNQVTAGYQSALRIGFGIIQ